jgi:hypothetical protein
MNCDLHEENSFDWLCSPDTLDSWASFRSEPLSPNKRAYGTWPTPAFRPITPIHEFPLNALTSGVSLINQRDLLYDSGLKISMLFLACASAKTAQTFFLLTYAGEKKCETTRFLSLRFFYHPASQSFV